MIDQVSGKNQINMYRVAKIIINEMLAYEIQLRYVVT